MDVNQGVVKYILLPDDCEPTLTVLTLNPYTAVHVSRRTSSRFYILAMFRYASSTVTPWDIIMDRVLKIPFPRSSTAPVTVRRHLACIGSYTQCTATVTAVAMVIQLGWL